MSSEKNSESAVQEYEEALKLFTRYLKENNLKITRERRLILKELAFSKSHLDAEDMLLRLRRRGEKVSRATIYRTFDLLSKANLISKSDFGHNHFHYEKSIGDEHHDHMICNETGTVIEFSDPRLEKLLKSICDEHNFEMERRNLQIFGHLKE